MEIDLKQDGVYQVKSGELKKVSTPSSGYGNESLDECKRYAEKVYSNMVEQEKKGKGSQWLKYLYHDKGLPIAMTGFDDEGIPGIVNFKDGEFKKTTHPQRWLASMVAPQVEDKQKAWDKINRLQSIVMPGAQYMFAEFLEAHKEIHSANRGQVSSDMHIHIIKQVEGQYMNYNLYMKDVYDETEAMKIYQALDALENKIKNITAVEANQIG